MCIEEVTKCTTPNFTGKQIEIHAESQSVLFHKTPNPTHLPHELAREYFKKLKSSRFQETWFLEITKF